MSAVLRLLPVAMILLAGCSSPVVTSSAGSKTATRTAVPSATAQTAVEPTEGETRTDEQGAVVFTATPLNADAAGDTLDFEVTMNTHSVDVAWDLAARSVLRTDTGVEVQAVSWPIGSGHHYSGTMSFPGRTADGASILEGATVLTLVIRDTDVPERVFTWELES
jgi:hypothetical protein